MAFDTLSIVGVGLIGGSIGLAARYSGQVRRIIGIGRDADSLALAQGLEIVDETTTVLADGVADADLVIVCTPVDRIARQIVEAAASCRPGTILTDVGSTKASIVRDVQGRLPAGVHFVGGHPLTGSEKEGPTFARHDLFNSRVTVLTPTADTDKVALNRLQEFWQEIGSTVVQMDAESHDCTLAMTSHLPHLVASVLAGILPDDDRPLVASGFRGTTRIAAGDPELWTAIFRENGPALIAAMDQFADRFDEYRHAVKTMNQDALIRLWTHGKQVRDALGS